MTSHKELPLGELESPAKIVIKSSYVDLLRNRNFLRIWVSQIVSLSAQNMIQWSLLTIIFELANKSSFATSVLLVILTLPPLFLATYAGVYADKHNRKAILITTNALRAVVVLFFLLAGRAHGSLALSLTYSIAFLFAVVNQFFIPAETASLPNLVKKEELLKANSLFTQSLYATFVVGIILAGAIQGTFGLYAPFFFACGMFLTCTIILSGLPPLSQAPEVETHRAHFLKELFEDTVDSYRLIRKRLNLFVPILELTFSQVTLGAMVVLAPAFVTKILALDVKQAGLLLVAPAGLAMLITAVTLGLINPKRRTAISRIGFVLLGSGLMVLALIKNISSAIRIDAIASALPAGFGTKLLMVGLCALIGVGLALIFVPAQTALSENAEERIRGQVFGFLNLSINVSATLPLLITGILADLFSVENILFVFGVLTVVYVIGEGALVGNKHLANS